MNIFVLAHKNLAFNKNERSMMRGYLISKFLDAQTDDKVGWLSDLKGLSEENATRIIKDSIKIWKDVFGIIRNLDCNQ